MKVTLTESQVNRLIGGYKQLNEQGEGFNQQTVTKSIDLGATFESGKYLLGSSVQSNVKKRLKPLVDFLIANPSSDVKITIVAGESRVTNYDREKCGPGIYTAECKLKPKQLSLLRAQQIEVYLNKLFVNLKSNGTIPKLPPKPTISTVLGSTKYVQGEDDPNDPKYKEEQKIELLIDAEASYECLVGMKISISYEGPTGHTCDEALFDVQLNNVSLGVANLNNGNRDMKKVMSRRIIGKKIKQYNDIISAKHKSQIASMKIAIKRYGPKTSPTSKKNGLMLKDYKVFDQTLESLGFPQKSWTQAYQEKKLPAIYRAIREQVIYYHGGIKYSDETIVDELIVKKMDTLYRFKPDDIGKPITDVIIKGTPIQNKLWKIEGRETDNKLGGIRRQVFTLDQSKAKSIVDGGEIKNMLILSITPLVSKSGPYKEFFNDGSHSDVPTVKITNGDGETLYSGNPTVKMTRGSLKKTTLLRTDLCGKPLKR